METRSCIQNSDFQKVVCLILLEGNLSTFICWKPVYHDRLIFTYYNVTMFQLCCTQRRIPGEYPAAADVRGGAGVLGPGLGDSSTRPRSGTWRGCCWAWPSTGSSDTYLVSRKVVRKSEKVIWLKIPRSDQDAVADTTQEHWSVSAEYCSQQELSK